MSTEPEQLHSRITKTERIAEQQQKDIGSLKTDVGKLQIGQDNLVTGQNLLQETQNRNHTELRHMLAAQKAEPSKISAGQLLTLIMAGAILIGAFWATINLLVSPIKDTVNAHVQLDTHPASDVRLSKLESVDEQQNFIQANQSDIIEMLAVDKVREARLEGANEQRFVGQSTELHRLDSMITRTETKLQAEMQQRDETLQRKMDLQVSRLDAMIESNFVELNRLQENQLTSSEGDTLQIQINRLFDITSSLP